MNSQGDASLKALSLFVPYSTDRNTPISYPNADMGIAEMNRMGCA
jgi:hypothetical protein